MIAQNPELHLEGQDTTSASKLALCLPPSVHKRNAGNASSTFYQMIS